MDDGVEQLLERLDGDDADAQQAALTLRMLVGWDTAEDDVRLRGMLGDEWATYRLSPDGRRTAIEGLIEHLQGPAPHPSAAWALGKSADPGCVPALAALLARTRDDPAQGDLALQTLNAIVVLGPGTPVHNTAVAAIRGAAASRHAEVAQGASEWLRLHGGSDAQP
jgi:hypothetical protein